MKKFFPLQVLLALFLMVLPAKGDLYGSGDQSCDLVTGDCYTQEDCEEAGGYWCPEGYCSMMPCQADHQDNDGDNSGDLYGDMYGNQSCDLMMGDCYTQEDCEEAGGYWCPEGYCSMMPCQDTASNDNETSNTNEDSSANGTYQPLPQRQVIGMADPDSAPAKVVSMMGRPFSSMSFKYQQPVDILAGFASCDFNKMYWLNPSSCNMGEAFSWLARKKVLSCPLVSLPEANGYLFWLVSPVEIINLDFENGAYMLQFLPVGNCQ